MGEDLDIGTSLTNAANLLNSNLGKKVSWAEDVSDINNPPDVYMFRTTVNPMGLPELNANSCIVLQFSGGSTYKEQLSMSFGGDKLAIRRKFGFPSWTAWKYLIAT